MKSVMIGVVTLLVLLTGQAEAQTTSSAAGSWQALFFNSPATALPFLQAAAAHHSASLGALEKEKSVIREDVQLARKDVLSVVALSGIYNYGNLSGGTIVDPNNSNVLGGGSRLRHSMGVNVTLPLDRLVSRRNLIQKQEFLYQQADLRRQDRENSLRQEVIQRYQEVLLAKKTLTIYQQAYLSAQTEHELAERQFREGQSLLGELSQVNGRYAQAAVAQESANSQYETSFLLLEELVGGHLPDIMTSK